MEILIESKYLAHEGGTKFYEVVQFYNVNAKRFVVVNRWGKMTAKEGGGDTKVERFADIRKCQDAARKKLQEKSGRGYNEQAARFGLHASTGKVDADVLRLELGKHYDDLNTIDAIMDGLGLDDLPVAQIDPMENDIVVEEPQPEPERGDDWGSW